MAGGTIRNVALSAAFLAADEDTPLRMRYILAAARTGYLKLARTLAPGGSLTTTVSRHQIATDSTVSLVEVLMVGVAEALEDVPNYPEELSFASGCALLLARRRCLLDPTAREIETRESFVLAMQVFSAIFATARKSDGEVECRIADEVKRIPATGPRYYTDAGNWIKALWLAIICRESDQIDMLSEIPIELLRASGAVYDEYIYHWVNALQTYWREGRGLMDKLAEAFEGTDPESLQVADKKLMLYILYPPMEMFYYFLREDHEKFNKSLLQALQLHNEFWTANEERATDPDGFVALGPLAIASLAVDAGVPVDIESEYMPEYLLRPSWQADSHLNLPSWRLEVDGE